VSPILELFVWILGVIFENEEADTCLYSAGVYELCVGGGNPVPEFLDDEYFPVEGTDVAVTIERKF